MNIPLLSAIFSIAFTVIVGILMIITIVLDKINATTMIGAVIVGAVISLPVAFVVSKKLGKLGKSS